MRIRTSRCIPHKALPHWIHVRGGRMNQPGGGRAGCRRSGVRRCREHLLSSGNVRMEILEFRVEHRSRIRFHKADVAGGIGGCLAQQVSFLKLEAFFGGNALSA